MVISDFYNENRAVALAMKIEISLMKEEKHRLNLLKKVLISNMNFI